MDTSREIKEDSSFNMTLLILVIGLVGIGGALLLNNIPLFGMIIALPLLCITTTVQRNYPIGSVDLNRNHSSDVLV